MKQYSLRVTCIGLALAVLGLLSAPSAALAQMKGAQRLMRIQTVEDLQHIEAGDTIVMSCPKCKDTYIQVVDKSLKGFKVGEMKNVPVHLCDQCDTKIVTQGTGKQAKDTLVHTCKACGSEDVSCCVIKKHGGATKGMEEQK
jgi:Fe-S oxidoreductase